MNHPEHDGYFEPGRIWLKGISRDRQLERDYLVRKAIGRYGLTLAEKTRLNVLHRMIDEECSRQVSGWKKARKIPPIDPAALAELSIPTPAK